MIYEERSVLVSDTSVEPVTIQGKALAATIIAPTGSKDYSIILLEEPHAQK